MGIHTGVTSSSDVAFNKTAGRTQYSGEFLMLAKLIQDAAQGGQILATAGTERHHFYGLALRLCASICLHLFTSFSTLSTVIASKDANITR